jgi:hypothetical protein
LRENQQSAPDWSQRAAGILPAEREAIAQKGNNHSPIHFTTMPCQRDAGSTLNTYTASCRQKKPAFAASAGKTRTT